MRDYTGHPDLPKLYLAELYLREQAENARLNPDVVEAARDAEMLNGQLGKVLNEIRGLEGKAPSSGKWGGA